MLRSIINVRKFFIETKSEDFLNTTMMFRHGIAFSLYLIGTIGSAISLLFVNIYPNSEEAYNIFSACYIADFVMEFISQALLCQLFWVWGEKEDDEVEVTLETINDRESYKSVKVTDFDDNDMDARIWNTMVKRRLQKMEENMPLRESEPDNLSTGDVTRSIFTVSAQEI